MKQAYLGVLSLSLTGLLALLVFFLQIPNPMMVLILPVIYFTYLGGWSAGTMSGIVSFFYSLVFFSNKGELFTYNSVNIQKVGTIIVCLTLIIVLIGKLKKRERNNACELQKLNKELESFAFFDPLTSAFNRHALTSHFGNIDKASASGLSFAILDLDHFKAINDTYGHVVGDKVLVHAVAQLWEAIPSNSHLYRLGGEEFLLIMKTADKREVLDMLEQIRSSIEKTPLRNGDEQVSLTVSIGCSGSGEGSTIHDCILLADQCLYVAKKSGRNRVVSAWYKPGIPSAAGLPQNFLRCSSSP